MTTYQNNFDLYCAFKAQSALGSPASGSGATILRWAGGTPGKLTKNPIASKEVRRDAQMTRGRHGLRKTAGGPYDVEYSVGCADPILEALFRGTWDTEITLDSGDFTSITISSNVITLASGDPRSLGIRVHDIVELTGSDTSANNSRNLRVTAVSATTITVVACSGGAALTDAGSADTNASIVRRGRKVIMPAAGSLVNTYFTVEEYEADADQSTLYSDCFWSGAKFTMQPDGLLMFAPQWIGTGDITAETTGNSPMFASPTTPTGSPLAVLDATLRLGGSDIADLTAFDLTIDNGAVAPAVAAANKSPTVLPGQNTAAMNLTLLRSDLTYLSDFINETGLSLNVLAVDTASEPKNFISINVPFFTLGGVDPSAPSTQGGARTQTISIPSALIGSDTGGTGYDATMVSIQISNNS